MSITAMNFTWKKGAENSEIYGDAGLRSHSRDAEEPSFLDQMTSYLKKNLSIHVRCCEYWTLSLSCSKGSAGKLGTDFWEAKCLTLWEYNGNPRTWCSSSF